MFNDQLKQLLAKYLQAKAVAPMIPGAGPTHAIASTVLDKVRTDLNDTGTPPHPLVGIDDLPPPVEQMPVPAAQPPQAPAMPPAGNTPLGSTPAAPVVPPTAPTPDMQGGYGSKYDDAARERLYSDLAQKRQQGAGWEAVGSIADLNTRIGGGTPINSAQTIASKITDADKLARSEFETGRTAAVGEHERAVTAQDKRDAVKAALEQKALDREARSEDKRYGMDALKAQKDLTLSTKQDQFNEGLTAKLRKEIETHPVFKTYMTIKGATEQAKKALANPSAYGDLSLIYSTIKGLDAQSAVREGEVALMREMASLKDRASGYFKALATGQTLTDAQKKDVVAVLDRMNAIAKDNLDFTAAPIINQGKRAKLQENEYNPMYVAPKPVADHAGADQRRARIAQLRAELGK